MTYSILKIIIYLLSLVISTYALSCIDFARYIKKSKVREFHLLFMVLSIGLAYLLASFIIEFTTIRLG